MPFEIPIDALFLVIAGFAFGFGVGYVTGGERVMGLWRNQMKKGK